MAKYSYEFKKKVVQAYRTRMDECWHLPSCSSPAKSKILTTISEVKAMGLRACKRCTPPK